MTDALFYAMVARRWGQRCMGRVQAVLECPTRDQSSFSLAMAALQRMDAPALDAALEKGLILGDWRRSAIRRWIDGQRAL